MCLLSEVPFRQTVSQTDKEYRYIYLYFILWNRTAFNIRHIVACIKCTSKDEKQETKYLTFLKIIQTILRCRNYPIGKGSKILNSEIMCWTNWTEIRRI